MDEDATDKFMQMRRNDQQRALDRLRSDPQLQSLKLIEAPLLDLEVRGVPALSYFGSQVWREGALAPHEDQEQGAGGDTAASIGQDDEALQTH